MKYFSVFFGILFVLSCSKPTTEQIIGIQVYKGFDKELLDSVIVAIQSVYDYQIRVLPEEVLPEMAFVNIKSPRYRADSIIRILKREKPDSISLILGLTEKDLSTTKKDKNQNVLQPESKYNDWGIMGLGYIKGPSCVVSSFRLKNANRKLFVNRLQKVSVHELGHTIGLPHCPTPKCVMQDAVERIQTIDHADLKLCDKCKEMIN